jgi:VIT1/CCC1 family predicted Fe2+/Mn2+ transporter
MAPGGRPRRERILDPVSRVSEILFGLIMALTFTTAVGPTAADGDEARVLLSGVLACNIAWGLVDAVMYLVSALTDRMREAAGRTDLPRVPSLTPRDWLGALAVFLLVFLSTFPVVIPFLVIDAPRPATRVSNLIAIVMLFACGSILARAIGYPVWRAGLAMVILGTVLTAITIALGG